MTVSSDSVPARLLLQLGGGYDGLNCPVVDLWPIAEPVELRRRCSRGPGVGGSVPTRLEERKPVLALAPAGVKGVRGFSQGECARLAS